MYRTILVPVDGSKLAEHALPLALTLARRAHAGIHLVTVSVPFAVDYLEGVYVGPGELEEEYIRRSRAYLEALTARLRSAPATAERAAFEVPITSAVLSGEIAPTLCDLAAGRAYGLVVMATHGRSPLGRFFLGSVADQMLQRAGVPLLLVRSAEESQEPDLTKEADFRHVVLPLDGTPLAEQILEPAVALAELAPETEIVLVRAIPTKGPTEESDVADTSPYREARAYLESVAARLQARGLRVRTHVVFEDKPGEAILHEADNVSAGLIAIETHGRTGLSRLLHGSVADKVLRGAHVPILVHRHAEG